MVISIDVRRSSSEIALEATNSTNRGPLPRSPRSDSHVGARRVTDVRLETAAQRDHDVTAGASRPAHHSTSPRRGHLPCMSQLGPAVRRRRSPAKQRQRGSSWAPCSSSRAEAARRIAGWAEHASPEIRTESNQSGKQHPRGAMGCEWPALIHRIPLRRASHRPVHAVFRVHWPWSHGSIIVVSRHRSARCTDHRRLRLPHRLRGCSLENLTRPGECS